MEAFSLLKYWKAADNATLAPPYTDETLQLNAFSFHFKQPLALQRKPQLQASLHASHKFKVDEVPIVSLFAKASQQGNVAETTKVKLGQKQGNVALPAGLRKHLGKARSAAVPPPPPPALVSSKRRDDSLLQQHDWIQGSILLCKNSFNASPECEISQLPRSVSDGSPELSENSKNDRVPLRYNIINFHVPGTHRRNMLLRASDNSCFG
ncbi:hypothetical protein JHK87_020100 [Glycine soja]|nr:hypothetical protein JHK87_020100 [Glycine soja]